MTTDEKLNELLVAQAVANNKLDNLTSLLKGHISQDDEKFKDHETRLRSSERARWYIGGGVGAISVLVSYLLPKV